MTKMQAEIQRVALPDGWTRPETGPMQFGDDWPGIFIRGDNAMALAMHLQAVLDRATASLYRPEPTAAALISLEVVEGLLDDLRSCEVGRRKEKADAAAD